MGCDIHPYVEIFKDGRWQAVEPDDGWTGSWEWDFRSRSYFCWAMLADVRNYDDIPPIAEARGLPDDLSAEVRAEAKADEGDAHSHSWFTLRELVAFDFDARVTFKGHVTLAEFKRSLETGQPGSVLGSGGHEISHDEMRRLAVEGQSPDDQTKYCTYIRWQDSYRNSCRPLLAFIERLQKEGPPDRVRLVFWFDN